MTYILVYFFLTCQLVDSMLNSRVYRIYLEFIEFTQSLLKKSLLKSQLIKDKWTRKLVRDRELTREFDNHRYKNENITSK